MKARLFSSFLEGEVSVPDFYRILKPELLEYIESRKKLGSSSSIYVEDEDEVEYKEWFTKNQLFTLLTIYLEGKLGEWDLEYILNWIEMSEFDLGERSENIIFYFSTPEINYPITKANIKEAIRVLKGEKLNGQFEGSFNPTNYRSLIVR